MRSRYQPRSKSSAFTLIELLVVIAISAILAAILFPVFAQAREKARQASCLSNTKQLGLAVYQYYQDYDEVGPNGNYLYGSPGGWAGQLVPYIKSSGVFHCPSDTSEGLKADTPSSYAMNSNLSAGGSGNATGNVYYPLGNPVGTPGLSFAFPMADLKSPAKTVMLFEVEGSRNIDVTQYYEGPYDKNYNGSPAGNGALQGYSPTGGGTTKQCPPANANETLKYATGWMGGRDPNTFNMACFYTGKEGRHSGGSNFLMADTHAKWFRGSQVSAGRNAGSETANQTGGQYNNAAGTSGNFADGTGVGATFSIR